MLLRGNVRPEAIVLQIECNSVEFATSSPQILHARVYDFGFPRALDARTQLDTPLGSLRAKDEIIRDASSLAGSPLHDADLPLGDEEGTRGHLRQHPAHLHRSHDGVQGISMRHNDDRLQCRSGGLTDVLCLFGETSACLRQ